MFARREAEVKSQVGWDDFAVGSGGRCRGFDGVIARLLREYFVEFVVAVQARVVPRARK
jgi:hypothetical protein